MAGLFFYVGKGLLWARFFIGGKMNILNHNHNQCPRCGGDLAFYDGKWDAAEGQTGPVERFCPICGWSWAEPYKEEEGNNDKIRQDR